MLIANSSRLYPEYVGNIQLRDMETCNKLFSAFGAPWPGAGAHHGTASDKATWVLKSSTPFSKACT